MNEILTPQQVEAFNNSSPDERFDKFVDGTLAAKTIWGLSSDKGWAIISDDGDEYFPAWPDPGLALLWATDGYSDCSPKAITLDDWLEKWLPGMVSDNIQIAVCPDIDGEGIVVEAEELLNAYPEAE